MSDDKRKWTKSDKIRCLIKEGFNDPLEISQIVRASHTYVKQTMRQVRGGKQNGSS